MRKIVSVLALSLLSLIHALPVAAIVSPLEVPNNHFGIHVIDESDLPDAAKLLNSTNGDWGYVAIVIPQYERDRDKWQKIFNRMRQLHLIPIVRLATQPSGDVWEKPKVEEAANWAQFLNSLNWVVQNRYVMIFNEPNHAKEWGGSVNPEEYAAVLKSYAQELKKASPDFFVLPAGLDASAPNDMPRTMDEVLFLSKMISNAPEVFSYVDGWNSHSYPNPGFSSSPQKTGRESIRTFEWEQTLFGMLGLSNATPIFITETGWQHGSFPKETVANYFQTAYTTAWNNPNVVAVTPFVLNYQSYPFEEFSWKQFNSSEFYPQFHTVAALPKVAGAPKQIDNARFIDFDLPQKLVTDSEYKFPISVENTGQSIWELAKHYQLSLTLPYSFQVSVEPVRQIDPFEMVKLEVTIHTPPDTGTHTMMLQMQKNETLFGQELRHEFTVVPPPNVFIRAQQWFKRITEGNDFSFLVYDGDSLLTKVAPVAITNGEGEIAELRNIVPNRTYRFVLLKPFYLPTQINAQLLEKDTVITFSRLLPFDFNNDGALTFTDFFAVQKPLDALQRLFPF